MRLQVSREMSALLIWLVAGFVWFGMITPMRAEQQSLLADQSRVRRERLRADRSTREAASRLARVQKAMAGACRVSDDPAALRQRIVAAASGLSLAPLGFSVSGPPAPGATVDAQGDRTSALELIRRLGDPARGGFLRSASLRNRSSTWSVSVSTGVIEANNPLVGAPVPPCAEERVSAPLPTPEAAKESRPPAARPTSSPRARVEPVVEPVPMELPPPPPPFSLVAFVEAGGRLRVSVRAGAEIAVLSVGDELLGWKCLSIDRDTGAAFVDATGRRIVLKLRTH